MVKQGSNKQFIYTKPKKMWKYLDESDMKMHCIPKSNQGSKKAMASSSSSHPIY